jgi:molybdopterin-synthase adenylyltransferase
MHRHAPSRYERQALLPQIGAAGQEKLSKSHVLLVGCGALGCHAADQLVRAGIGKLRLVDRDIVELTNLQRQTLFDEEDANAAVAKAAAAARRLNRINSTIGVEPVVADFWAGNAEELLDGVDLILDGTDNVQTRYVLNDVSVKHGIPWIHAACVGTEGRVMSIIPGQTACLRCVFPTPPDGKELPTCDTAGVLQAAAATAASFQVAQAIRVLITAEIAETAQVNHTDSASAVSAISAVKKPLENGVEVLISFDVWKSRFNSIDLHDSRRADCPCCGQRDFEFLRTNGIQTTISLCGRNAVQIRPARAWNASEFETAVSRLQKFGETETRPFFSRCRLRDPAGVTITFFKDGRLLVDGTADTGRAQSICARFLGA